MFYDYKKDISPKFNVILYNNFFYVFFGIHFSSVKQTVILSLRFFVQAYLSFNFHSYFNESNLRISLIIIIFANSHRKEVYN